MALTLRLSSTVLLGLALSACSAGRAPSEAVPSAAAALAASHGSAAEVRMALEVQGLPCVDEVRLSEAGVAEQLIGCRIEGEQVVVAHFVDVPQAENYRAVAEKDGKPGAYASTWAVQTTTADLAQRVAAALRPDVVLAG